ncbi:hypothetical protein OHQ88_33495 (plasmid) [Micromonospora zamorensis]|uniref:hypothetical protein n=1 Tax=Micromonospora zamorensis TaxID=709883 RepID=UPI002E1DD079
MTTPPPATAVEPGTLLRLESDDWSYGRDLTAATKVAVVVTRLRTELAHVSDDWMWVLGHRPECANSRTGEHQPCMELRVKVTALRRFASTQDRRQSQ